MPPVQELKPSHQEAVLTPHHMAVVGFFMPDHRIFHDYSILANLTKLGEVSELLHFDTQLQH